MLIVRVARTQTNAFDPRQRFTNLAAQIEALREQRDGREAAFLMFVVVIMLTFFGAS